MAKIYAPNRQYTGLSAGVMFVSGVGETDDAALIEWFVNKGYSIDQEPVAAVAIRKQIAGLRLISPEAHNSLFAEKEALQARVVDLEQALKIANEEIERLSPSPPTADPDALIEPVEEVEPEPAKTVRKAK